MKISFQVLIGLLLSMTTYELFGQELASGRWEAYYWNSQSVAGQNLIYGVHFNDIKNPPFGRNAQGSLDFGSRPLNQNFGQSAPVVGFPQDYFSIQYVKAERLYLQAGAVYQFGFSADDQVRIRLNSTVVFSNIGESAPNQAYQVVNFQVPVANWYTLTVDLVEQYLDARVAVSMKKIRDGVAPICSGGDYWDAEYYQNKQFIGTRVICGRNLNENWDENRLPLPNMIRPISNNWYQVVYKSNVRCFGSDRVGFDYKGNNTLILYLSDQNRFDINKDALSDFDPDYVGMAREDGYASPLRYSEKWVGSGACRRIWAFQTEMGNEAIAIVNVN